VTSVLDRAKQFIDDVIRINEEHGMRTVISEETYNEAVRSAANAYKRLNRSASAEQHWRGFPAQP
jgi:hypothetical protein